MIIIKSKIETRFLFYINIRLHLLKIDPNINLLLREKSKTNNYKLLYH